MKDLRFFETEADYKNASIEYPNVSYTKDSEDVWIIDNPNNIIMTSESNPAAMEVCYLQGWAANENYMTKAEAEAVTDIGTAFKNSGNSYGVTMKELYSFNEFKYFTNVTSIGNGAFSYCYLLSEITIPSGVTSIGEDAFRDCSSLSSVTFAEDSQLQSIGASAFEGCHSLTNVTIPNSVTSIGVGSFNECDSLTSITIPSGVTEIGNYAFNGCGLLNEITCLAVIAPTISAQTFLDVKSNGVLKYPSGSDYSSWMSTSSNYLGKYNWTSQEI